MKTPTFEEFKNTMLSLANPTGYDGWIVQSFLHPDVVARTLEEGLLALYESVTFNCNDEEFIEESKIFEGIYDWWERTKGDRVILESEDYLDMFYDMYFRGFKFENYSTLTPRSENELMKAYGAFILEKA